ncbi:MULTISPECIES: hypothetical protein [Brevundimonas]|nr:hypothetical protein [Brevundimonas pishanensis]
MVYVPLFGEETGRTPMVAIATIFAFIAVIAAVNYYEFGSID